MIFQNYDKTKFQHYLIFHGGKSIEIEMKDLGIKVHTSKSLKKKISIGVFFDIYKFLKNYNIDIIHTHLVKPYAIAGLTNIFLRKKIIFNYHGIFLKNNPYYSFFQRLVYQLFHLTIYLFKKVDVVLVPSKRSSELLMDETKLFPKPIVYYNGYSNSENLQSTDNNLASNIEKLKKNKILIAVVGRLEIDKRIDRALNLIQRLVIQKENLYLLIFGDGSLKDKLQNQVDNLNLNNFIHFFGYVKGLQNYYKYFDMLLFTSDWEGMPLSMWEAMANEVPIVAPDVGGFKEILEENNCGLVYEPANMVEAEEKITRLFQNLELKNTLGQNGKLAIQNKYQEQDFINQLEQKYFRLFK